MNDLLDLATIQERIETAGRKISELLEEVRSTASDAAITEASFKSLFAQARLKARADAQVAGDKMTDQIAEDVATVATKDAQMGYLLAKNALTVSREALRARQSQLDALRTLAASFRAAERV